MKGDLPQAAFRLLTDERLIVRRHPGEYGNGEVQIKGGARTGGRLAKAVIIDGKRYESMNDAKVALHTSHGQIKKWVEKGRARYADLTDSGM